MSGESGMALGIALIAMVLPALLVLCGAALVVVGLWRGNYLLAGLGVGGVVAVATIWFFAFGIEYVPKYEPSPLVVPDGYEGAALVVACPDRGIPEGEPLVVDALGIARVQREQRLDFSHRTWRAKRTSGDAVSVQTVGQSGGGEACGFMQLHVGDSPYGHTVIEYSVLLAEVEATGKPFAEVFRANEM